MNGHFRESAKTPQAHELLQYLTLLHSTERSAAQIVAGYNTDIATAFLEFDARFREGRRRYARGDLHPVRGYENSYDGLFAEVLEAWQSLTGSAMPVVPYFAHRLAEANAKARSLGKAW